MKIETKFSNGDTVWHATTNDAPLSTTDCEECGGRGSLEIVGKAYRLPCPSHCAHGKRYVYGPKPYATRMTVGQVRVQVSDSPGDPDTMWDNYKPQKGREESYMCVETGIGSGSIYYVANLFHTEEEALERGKVLVLELIERRRLHDEQVEKEREQDRRRLVLEEA